jgi:hypothetical protein
MHDIYFHEFSYIIYSIAYIGQHLVLRKLYAQHVRRFQVCIVFILLVRLLFLATVMSIAYLYYSV